MQGDDDVTAFQGVTTRFTPSFILALLTLVAIFVLVLTGDVDAAIGVPIIAGIGGVAGAGSAAAAGYQNGTRAARENQARKP